MIWIILGSKLKCTLQVPHHMFFHNQVNTSWLNQVLTQSVHRKAYIWSSVCQVHQWTNHLYVYYGINYIWRSITQQIQVWCHLCSHRFTFQHTKFVEDLHNIDLHSNIPNLFRISTTKSPQNFKWKGYSNMELVYAFILLNEWSGCHLCDGIGHLT